MFEYIQLLLIATIIGGMVTFQLLFAPLIFIKLPTEIARPFIRKFFPFYYLYFIILSIALSLVTYFTMVQDHSKTILSIFSAIALGFIVSRQIFMPLANKATDEGRKKAFSLHHRITVLINTLQLIGMLIALWLIV
jgi:hypothetical protein